MHLHLHALHTRGSVSLVQASHVRHLAQAPTQKVDMVWRRKTQGDANFEHKTLESGERLVLAAGIQQEEAALLLASPWKRVFEAGAKAIEKQWKAKSVGICTVVMLPTPVPGIESVLKWVCANCRTLMGTLEGHRLVEASLRRHIDVVGDAVAAALLADTLLENPWVGRVWSCFLRYGKHLATGQRCAAVMAERAEAIWEGDQNASAMYVLQTLVQCDYDVAAQVVALWDREDTIRKLTLRQPHYMTFLLECLRSPRPERRQLVASFLLLFKDVDVCYTLMKALLRVKPVGIQILCELAQASFELNVWFSDYLQDFLTNLDAARPQILLLDRLLPPTRDAVEAWLQKDRTLESPKAFRCAHELAKNGASALALYCRLLAVQFDQTTRENEESECATPKQLWSATPLWLEE